MTSVRTADGIDLAVHELGGPAGAPTLLIAHATGFHGHCYAPMVDAGLGARFRCVAPDLRGHGDSPATPQQVSDWSAFGADVLAVLDAVAATEGPVHAFGHSMGGAALVIAELARPGTFAALWLFEPILPPPSTIGFSKDNPLAEGAERRREVFDSYEAAIANFSSKPPLSAFTPEAMRAYVLHGFAEQPDGTVRLKCPGAVEAATFRAAGSHEAFARLGELTCPVTIGVGDPREPGPSAFGVAAAEAVPHGRLEDLSPLGHFAPQQDPAAVARAVLAAFTLG